MAKHTQTICRHCLSVFGHFVGLGLKGLRTDDFHQLFKTLTRGFTAQKIKFSFKNFFSKCDQIRKVMDLVTFTEEILNRKLHFLCSACNITSVNHVTSMRECLRGRAYKTVKTFIGVTMAFTKMISKLSRR